MKTVYLDYLSTTPLDAQVAAAMAECLTLDGTFGNPASRSHRYGWEAEMAVETARQQLAALIGADVREIVFTSGATEADNLAIKGVAEAALRAGSAFVFADDRAAPVHIFVDPGMVNPDVAGQFGPGIENMRPPCGAGAR